MGETRVPEWFIGGPLHGKDRLTEYPDAHPRVIPVAYDRGEWHESLPAQRTYVRQKFTIGRTVLTIWIVDGMDEWDAGDRLAEILLAPHRTDGGAGE